MEETLTDCLIRVREDLSQLKKVRNYLETNADTEERCTVTWRTIEAFNSILSVCSSQNSPETPALDTLLDSFFYLARNNADNTVWDDFGFELGIICVKVLSAIERTQIFEALFCKLLSVISIVCEYNGNIWKATARQILNLLINKKITLSYLETILKSYISILRRIDNEALCEFSGQNFHLLKTFFLAVQKIGDFEIQSDITELIYLHLSKDTKLMFEIFEREQFIDFKNDCRLYLNSLNKSRKGCDKKVYSICCHVLYLGACSVEPPVGRNFIWVDANKDTGRLSIKFFDSESESDGIMYVPFSRVLTIRVENQKSEDNLSITIKTKKFQQQTSCDICIVTENVEGVDEFIWFLETEINGGKKKKKTSKTMESLVIDRSMSKKEVQDTEITSSYKPEIRTPPDVLPLFVKVKQTATKEGKAKAGSQELTQNSFVESLNRHIMGSPDLRETCEDSVETIEFLQKTTPERCHKLFRSPSKIFNVSETDFGLAFGEDKENKPFKVKTNMSCRKPKRVLKDRQNLEGSQSQECFRGSSVLKKKPFLPKLKRSKLAVKKKEKEDKTKEMEVHIQEEHSKNTEPKTSLLDPNGYAYQRWCKPTTSERSNFWLKKLGTLQKSKIDSENVFDFSEESDSVFGKQKKKRVIHSKRKCRTKKGTKQTSLSEVKEILKKTSPIKEKEIQQLRAKTPEFLHPHESPPKQYTTHDSEYESLSSSDDEEVPPQNKKRELSQESSSGKCVVKKKQKISLPKNIITSLRRRLEEVEEKDRRYTAEIIRTVDKATNHLFNHIQRKDGEKFMSYLKTAEEVSISFESGLEDLNLRAKRTQRAVSYFKAGCSVGDFFDFLTGRFSKVREEFSRLKGPKDRNTTVERICNRLSSLIGTEIEKSLKAEWILKRNRMLKCASILGSFEPEI